MRQYDDETLVLAEILGREPEYVDEWPLEDRNNVLMVWQARNIKPDGD